MTPLNVNMQPSSALTPEPEACELQRRDYTRERSSSPFSRRRRSSSSNNKKQPISQNRHLLFPLLLPLLLQPTTAQNQQQHHPQTINRGLSPALRPQRTLSDGITECASCPLTPNTSCSGSTLADTHCAPCATGQKYWPCNLMNECYCKDLMAEAALEASQKEAEAAFRKCNVPLCAPGYSGNSVVPFTKCEQYVTCTGGVPGPIQFCAADSMIYSSAIQACNIKLLATCDADPGCPPTMAPNGLGESTERPTAEGVVRSERPSRAGERPIGDGGANQGGSATGGGGGAPAGGANIGADTAPRTTTAMDPLTIEGLIVMDAHMAANKIMLTRQLLTSPDGSRGAQRAINGASNDDFSYVGFKSSLQTMITTGAANRTFYIGHSTPGENGMAYNGYVTQNDNGRVYGLVNIAAFLAMSIHDSIIHDSCNEVNTEIVNGLLPLSNACGQYGRSYQDMTCPKGEEMYDCANDVVDFSSMVIHANGWGGDYTKEKGFYCGSVEEYGQTGHWDYVSGSVAEPFGAENGLGRKDVEGCCWWGRGAIQLRGTCAYGKLNYFLGKRAADEGRPSMYPDVDFCLNPEQICSSPKYPHLKWIVGMFRWITEVQPYHSLGNEAQNVGEFHYMQQLVQFVDGGLKDWSFVHGLSGIVTQGCHSPPCYAGADLTDGAERKATFIKTLRLLGLSVKDDGVAATGRRLGDNN